MTWPIRFVEEVLVRAGLSASGRVRLFIATTTQAATVVEIEVGVLFRETTRESETGSVELCF